MLGLVRGVANEPCCDNCAYVLRGDNDAASCRRYPPTVIVIPQQTVQGPQLLPASAYAPVMLSNWCGEHAAVPAIDPADTNQ